MSAALETRNEMTEYHRAKKALMAAALAYAETPSEGRAYSLRVAARHFKKMRVRAGVTCAIAEEA